MVDIEIDLWNAGSVITKLVNSLLSKTKENVTKTMHVTWIKDKTNKLIDAPNGLPLMLNYLILFDTAWYSSRDL